MQTVNETGAVLILCLQISYADFTTWQKQRNYIVYPEYEKRQVTKPGIIRR